MTHPMPGDMTDDEYLAQGLAALQAGDNSRARRLLGQAVRSNPQDDRVWLGLARAFDEPARRRYCLERCLALNPTSEEARAALEQLTAAPQTRGAAEGPATGPEASPAPA
ncbi:MAG TPA: tetratricopeptide repeat protein, partial [Roseiflexaceae bacterium]|nr:tetratricopeptide repeat protein [Roseiflexaceae bacterium]